MIKTTESKSAYTEKVINEFLNASVPTNPKAYIEKAKEHCHEFPIKDYKNIIIDIHDMDIEHQNTLQVAKTVTYFKELEERDGVKRGKYYAGWYSVGKGAYFIKAHTKIEPICFLSAGDNSLKEFEKLEDFIKDLGEEGSSS